MTSAGGVHARTGCSGTSPAAGVPRGGVDLRFGDDADPVLRAIPAIKESLNLNVEPVAA